jgi:hypothetical protein
MLVNSVSIGLYYKGGRSPRQDRQCVKTGRRVETPDRPEPVLSGRATG